MLEVNRNYQFAFLHDADMASAIQTAELVIALNESGLKNISCFDIGLYPRQAKEMGLHAFPAAKFIQPSKKRMAKLQNESIVELSKYTDLVREQKYYDLNSVIGPNLQTWIGNQLVRASFVDFHEKDALQTAISSRVMSILKKEISNRLALEANLEKKAKAILETFCESHIGRLAEFAKTLSEIAPHSWSKHISDFVELALEESISKEHDEVP